MAEGPGISYSEVWREAARAKQYILFAALGAMALAFVVSIMVRPLYEAVMLVRIGQIAKSIQEAVPIEPPKTVLDRLRYPSFKKRVVLSVHGVGNERKLWMRAQLLASSNVVEIRVRGNSISEVNKIANAVLEELKTSHSRIASAALTVMHDNLEVVSASLKIASTQLDKARGVISATNPGSGQSAILASLLTEYLQAEVGSLRERQAALRRSLEFPFTYMTDIIEPVYVDAEPIFPNTALNVLLAAFAGIMVSILAIVMRLGRTGR